MSQTTLNDFQEALEAVSLLLRKNNLKDTGDLPEWQKIGLLQNAGHLREHLDRVFQMTRDVPLDTFDFDHFVSTACRALMLLEHAILEFPDQFASWLGSIRKL